MRVFWGLIEPVKKRWRERGTRRKENPASRSFWKTLQETLEEDAGDFAEEEEERRRRTVRLLKQQNEKRERERE